MLYFEDFREGDVTDWGSVTLSQEEIIEFAREFDPQPMHTDPQAAKDSMLGGLAASGWQTAAVLMRMMCDGFLLDAASMGSPGVSELRWELPVRPGDTLTARRTVLGSRPSRSRPEVGFVEFAFELFRQDGRRVLQMTCPIMFGRRPGAAA